MTPDNNHDDTLLVWADWCEEQGEDTEELREEIAEGISRKPSDWIYEHRRGGVVGAVVAAGVGVVGFVGVGSVGGGGVGGGGVGGGVGGVGGSAAGGVGGSAAGGVVGS